MTAHTTTDPCPPMNIALVTTVWGRMHITRPVLRHYATLDPEGVDLRCVAVCSSYEEGREVEEVDGWTATYYPNEPLNEKHNVGVERVRELEPDAVCVVNSDDLITGYYLESAAENIAEHGGAVRLLSSVFVDTVNARASYVPGSFPASGIVLSHSVLDALNWRPWEGDDIDRFLDKRLGYNLAEIEPPATCYRPGPWSNIQLCSLKSKQQMWSYKEHLALCEPSHEIEVDTYLHSHFPSALDVLSPNAEV